MAHFGVLSFRGTGHLNPLITLSRTLMLAGHRVTFFENSEIEPYIRRHGIEFCPIGPSHISPGMHGSASPAPKPTGSLALFRYRLRRILRDMEMFLRETPAAISRAGVDALIIDEIALSGPTVAEMLHLPYFLISTSVPHNFGWSAPRRFTPHESYWTHLQNVFLQVSVFRMRGPVRRKLDTLRKEAGLRPIRERTRTFPELAHITQLPQCVDFPRSGLPANFYYTGPFVNEDTRASVEFPWHRLDGRPLIYASLGTTLKGDPVTFRSIAEACDGLNLQLVISLGGRRNPNTLRDLAGDPLVVQNAPQLELLKKAAVVITHAGPNTALETLMQGKPMIAIPKAFDQPAIAARLERLGVAEVLPVSTLSTSQLRAALTKVLNDPSYTLAATQLQARIRSARGLERAAQLIQESLANYSDTLKNTASLPHHTGEQRSRDSRMTFQ